ncbi:hypothetical protein LBAT_0113 [Lactobacillus acetotolerans]|uniref:Uncharacterized protein n=1 Tax=Lactobacillus acetotolerans TaxID=1600 RepID=A0A0D6A101_9LACO|nr:bacteriocin immunity protein [Lactobacillus acetotolerans]BAQ56502.1 hypothetical protein LBAT_0113 [Lactobacillus acetotolerans]
MKRKQSLREKLSNIHLANEAEQEIVNSAIANLDKKENPHIVLSNMEGQLRPLALKGKLSKEGLTLLTDLERPNFDQDVATSTMTWFPK